ncbi:Protein of unknown function (DUF3736) [Branchiostoma belcheri]|nr:Protein of unknown function (DUF3736) [Branchiostoma belcheri]
MERSPSPSKSDHEDENQPCSPLTTSYTPEDMVQEGNLEDKKSFLAEMGLGFMHTEHRKEKQRDQQIVDAFKSGKLRSLLAAPSTNNHKVPSVESKRPPSNTGASSKDSTKGKPTEPETPSTQRLPPSPVQQPPTHNHSQPPFPNQRQPLQPIHPQAKASTSPVPPAPQQAPPPAHDRQPLAYRPQDVHNNVKKRSQEAPSTQKHENHQSFAQRFHESVLQSTQEALAQKQVHSIPITQQPEKPVSAAQDSWPRHARATPTHAPLPLLQQAPDRDDGSGEGQGRMNWPGVAVIMEAYQRYSQEQELEREVLQGQFSHLQTTHSSLNRTAETLSLRMGMKGQEVYDRTGTKPLSITITERRMRYAGHVLRMTSDRHAKTSMFWKPEGKRKRGRPKLTWRRTLQKDLESKGVSLKDAESLAKDRAEWRRLAAQCALHGRN